jgi:hypothetical protein
MSANDKLVLSQKKSMLKVTPCYVYDGTGFKYYIEKSKKKCDLGPIPTEINVQDDKVDFNTESDDENLWALAIAVLCVIVALSPHMISSYISSFYLMYLYCLYYLMSD